MDHERKVRKSSRYVMYVIIQYTVLLHCMWTYMKYVPIARRLFACGVLDFKFCVKGINFTLTN